jgi:hypothetical protein
MDQNQQYPPEEVSQSPTPLVQNVAEEKGRRRFSKIQLAVLAVVLSLVCASAVYFFLASRQQDDRLQSTVSQAQKVAVLGATLATIEGTVEYTQGDGTTWQKAVGGESLRNLSSVKTVGSSRAIVLFDDGSVARLDGNSEVHLSSLKGDGTEITLVEGQVYSRVVSGKAVPFTVVTANERFTALGTAYKTSLEGDTGTVDVYHSKVKAVAASLEVGEGNSFNTATKTVSALDLGQLQSDAFVQWNKQKDSVESSFKDKLGVLDAAVATETPQTQADTVPSGSSQPPGMQLSVSSSDKGVKLHWTISGAVAPQGFKIVRDAYDMTPTFGENSALYVSNGNARSETWHDDSGGTYYYRICIYRDGSCATYSNAVRATSPKFEKEQIVSGGISLSLSGQMLAWSLSGGTAPHGFKVVLSTEQNPVYPENSIVYLGAEARSVSLPTKDPGIYYVRVCKYTNGTQSQGCVDYSNQVQYTVSP